jgi:hypothetical protein
MVPYQMNLAKGRVLSLANRRQWRRWFAIYLAIVLIVLGWFVVMLTRKCVVISREDARLVLLERKVLSGKAGSANAVGQMQKLSREMAECEDLLKSIDEFRKNQSRAACVILGLANVLPAGMDLGNVSIDNVTGALIVEVHLVAEQLKANDAMTPPRLISLWNAEPLLSGRANHFTSGNSERVKVAGVDKIKWRFTGTLFGEKQ